MMVTAVKTEHNKKKDKFSQCVYQPYSHCGSPSTRPLSLTLGTSGRGLWENGCVCTSLRQISWRICVVTAKKYIIKCDVHAELLFCLFSLLSPEEQSFHFAASRRAVSYFSSESQQIESVHKGQAANPQGTTHSLCVALKKEGQRLTSYFAVGNYCLNFIFLYCLL